MPHGEVVRFDGKAVINAATRWASWRRLKSLAGDENRGQSCQRLHPELGTTTIEAAAKARLSVARVRRGGSVEIAEAWTCKVWRPPRAHVARGRCGHGALSG